MDWGDLIVNATAAISGIIAAYNAYSAKQAAKKAAEKAELVVKVVSKKLE